MFTALLGIRVAVRIKDAGVAIEVIVVVILVLADILAGRRFDGCVKPCKPILLLSFVEVIPWQRMNLHGKQMRAAKRTAERSRGLRLILSLSRRRL